MSDPHTIASSFLKAAPPGEFNEVFTDVKGILADRAHIFDSARTEEAHRNYNTDQMIAIDSGDHKFLVTSGTSVGGNAYFDSQTVEVHEVDHINQKVVSTKPSSEHDTEVEPWRAAMFFEVDNYVKNFFPTGTCAVTGSRDGGQFVLAIGISAHLFNSRSFYNGRWRSVWTVKFSPGASSDLNGKIRANVHFFEGGNVQLKTDADKSKRGIPAQNAQQLAQNIVGSIGALEADWQNQFENLFDNMGQTTYKGLRRALPMDCRVIGPRWGMIQSYKLGQDLTKS
jgi:capping protein alpha